MSKNIILGGRTYNGVSEVELPVSGGTAKFKDEDEIVVPTGTKQITANGNGINVAAFEKVDVHVPTGGDTPTYQEKIITANGTYTPDSGYDAFSKIIVAVAGGGGEGLGLTILEEQSSVKSSEEKGYSSNWSHGLSQRPDFAYIKPHSNFTTGTSAQTAYNVGCVYICAELLKYLAFTKLAKLPMPTHTEEHDKFTYLTLRCPRETGAFSFDLIFTGTGLASGAPTATDLPLNATDSYKCAAGDYDVYACTFAELHQNEVT